MALELINKEDNTEITVYNRDEISSIFNYYKSYGEIEPLIDFVDKASQKIIKSGKYSIGNNTTKINVIYHYWHENLIRYYFNYLSEKDIKYLVESLNEDSDKEIEKSLEKIHEELYE